MEREGCDISLPDRHRVTADLGQYHSLPGRFDPGGAENRANRTVDSPFDQDVVLEAGKLAAEAFRFVVMSSVPGCSRPATIIPARVPRWANPAW